LPASTTAAIRIIICHLFFGVTSMEKHLTTTIRKATLADLEAIIAVHQSAFAGFFLTSLGRGFLRELYRAFVVEVGGICWVALVESSFGTANVVGFVAGALDPERFFRRLLYRRGIYFAVAAVPGIASQPFRVVPRVLSALRYRGEQPNEAKRGALLSSLGVHPTAGRHGIGSTLVNAFIIDAERCGARGVYLTTDRNNNEGANAFYERAGFRMVATAMRRGRTMNTYERTAIL
jgi:ribosomal protein S18 acetylase RimI-like enzyme